MLGKALLLAVSVNLVAALPQSIDFDAVNALPPVAVQGPPVTGTKQAPTYKITAAAASAASDATASPVASTPPDRRRAEVNVFEVRSACDPQPSGSGPQTSPDDASDFLANPVYNQTADAAVVPQGYSLAFSNLEGSTSQNGYLGFVRLSPRVTARKWRGSAD